MSHGDVHDQAPARPAVRITLQVSDEIHRAARAAVAAHRARARLLAAGLPWQPTPAERVAQHAAFTLTVRRLRRAGELLDTMSALAEHAARLELAARGWDRDWPSPPPGGPLPGRWLGTAPPGLSARIVAIVDAALVRRVQAACHWTSADAIASLRDWRSSHPARRHSWAECDDYPELSARVTTMPGLLRAGLSRLLTPGR